MTAYAYETPRLWLEKLTVDEHVEDFHELWNNAGALVWSTQGVKETVEESRAWLLSMLPVAENPDIDKYAILLRPVEANAQPWVNKAGKPKMVGMTGTNRYSDEGLETGYCMNIAYWGRGYAGEAFRGFLELFWSLEERRQVKQLVAKVDHANVPSQRVVMRAGAVKGGVLKEWYSRLIDNGVKRDIEFWFIDRPEVTVAEMDEWKEEIKRQMVRKQELDKEKEKERKEEAEKAEKAEKAKKEVAKEHRGDEGEGGD